MNIKTFFLLLLFSLSNLFSQNFAGIYKGTIGKYPITLHLFVNNIMNNGKIHHNAWLIKNPLQIGYYYYDHYKKPIALFLNAKHSDNTIELSTANREKIIISFKDKFLQGSWVSKGGELQSQSIGQTFKESSVWGTGVTIAQQILDSVINIFRGEKVLTVNAQLSSKFIDLDYHVKEENLKFQKPFITQPICRGTFSIETVWPKGPDEMDYLRKIFREIIGSQAPTLSIEKILEYKANVWCAEFFNESDKEFKNELEYLTQEHDDYYNKRTKEEYLCPYFDHCDKIQIYCCYLSPTILSIEKYCHYEIGGRAHGAYDSYFTVVDLVNKKKITLENIFTADGIKELPRLLEESAEALDRSRYELDEKIPVVDNFFINERGVSFWYNPYEIARGPVELCIPFRKIRRYLNKDFIKLLEV